MDYEFGMLAWSRAGHDKDKLYVIIKTEGEYVYLSDGRLKPVERPKKRNGNIFRSEKQYRKNCAV